MTHASLQLMAFPWFVRQHDLYQSVAFPRVHRDVSTNKSSEGYARFLDEFLRANLKTVKSEVFLDLHAVVSSALCFWMGLISHRRADFDQTNRMIQPLRPMEDTSVSNWSRMDQCGESLVSTKAKRWPSSINSGSKPARC